MPDMVAVIRPDQMTFGASEADDVRYCGDVYAGQTSEQGPYSFTVDVARSATATQVNTALVDAAVAACAIREVTVGLLDKKTLVGGAIGL